MPRADFFTRFGIYAAPGFVGGEECRALVAELAASPRSAAEVYGENYARGVDEGARRTLRAAAPAGVAAGLAGRLAGLRSALEENFRTKLGGCEEPEFLVYRTGDFFRPHRDASPGARAHEHLRRRRVSVVLFLNGQAERPEPGSFCGASLVFYGLLPDPRAAHVGFPLAAEAGLLVAFPSDLLHEVTPVTHGERYAVVSWFGAAGGEAGRART